MRIALFTEVFLPKWDGVVNTLSHLLEHLERRGHQSVLFAPEGGPDQYAGTPIVGFPGYPFPLYPELKMVVPPYLNVHEQLEAFQPDLIHLINPVLLGISGQRYAHKVGIPVIASFHTDLGGFAEKWGLGMFSEPIWGYLRWIHNQADLNVCPSHATAEVLVGQGFENVQVWPRGVDTVQYRPEHRDPAWRERLGVDGPDAPLLLYVGRLSVEKRIKWIRPVLDLLPEARLAIVGDGPERLELEEYFAGTPTTFPGFLRGRDLAQVYASADLFVFPAANETLGNVVLEAMASGLPVVAAGSGGPLDLVSDGETGILFDPDDPQALVEATVRLLHDRALARRYGAAGRLHAEARTWAATLDTLLDYYAALIQEHAVPQIAWLNSA
ncbi:MAG: glycosyltransferase family 1 protein [Chloroflexota bacterium]